MRLSRLHLVELEDLPWFPALVRDLATDYLHFVETKMRLHAPVVPLLGEALKRTGSREIVDLCSGGGGPWLMLQHDLAAAGVDVRITLTDRYPNSDAFAALGSRAGETFRFEPESVDARHVPERLKGFRTMFNAFHHFTPKDAQAILQNAAEARQPIGIFELPDRAMRMLLPMIFLTPLIVCLVTPAIRPFRWERLLLTYLIPAVPFVCWFDGIVSQLRAYSPEELRAMTAQIARDGYEWTVGQSQVGKTAGNLTYVIGVSRNSQS